MVQQAEKTEQGQKDSPASKPEVRQEKRHRVAMYVIFQSGLHLVSRLPITLDVKGQAVPLQA